VNAGRGAPDALVFSPATADMTFRGQQSAAPFDTSAGNRKAEGPKDRHFQRVSPPGGQPKFLVFPGGQPKFLAFPGGRGKLRPIRGGGDGGRGVEGEWEDLERVWDSLPGEVECPLATEPASIEK
jgi:hypothetical protein